MRQRAAIRHSLLLLLAAVLAGCVSRSPAPSLYQLTALAPQTATAGAAALALAIGPAQLPRVLERSQILRRASDHRLEQSEFERWAGPLDRELLRVLGDNLARLLGTERISVYPATPPFPVDYRVTLEVQQFDGVLGEAVTLRARWMLLGGEHGRAVAVRQFERRQEVHGRDYEAFVRAHSEALAALGEAIAATLAELTPR